jgi:hypothetical protein
MTNALISSAPAKSPNVLATIAAGWLFKSSWLIMSFVVADATGAAPSAAGVAGGWSVQSCNPLCPGDVRSGQVYYSAEV